MLIVVGFNRPFWKKQTSKWQRNARQNYRDKAPVVRNNQQIRIAQTDRTFIVRYREIPPPLFITETPNLLGVFLSCFFFLYGEQRSDMTGLNVECGGICGGPRRKTTIDAIGKTRSSRAHRAVTIASLELQPPCWIIAPLFRLSVSSALF